MKKKLINMKNSKLLFLILGFLLGITLTCGSVYATTVLSGSNVSYSNTSSKLTATTVQGAIDEIYNKIKNNTFKTNTAKTVYASKKGVCIERNNKLNCIKPNNWVVEKDHIQQVFSDVSCNVYSSYVSCDASDFYCIVYSNGLVGCFDYSNDSKCDVSSDGSVSCT